MEGEKTVAEKNLYTIKCLTEILQSEFRIHQDNTSSHSARITVAFLEQKCIKEKEHPPYSSDFDVSDF